MMTKLKILLVLLLLQMPQVYASQKPVEQLQNFLTTTKTLTSNFKQVVYDESGKVKQTSYGVFSLSRPGKFRWNYQKPFLQEIVSNNGKVWFYDADLAQVTVKRLDKSMGSTPALLLTGDVELEKEFTLENQGDEEGLEWIKLVPKNLESNFKYVLLGLNAGSLAGMELSDNFGQLTRIYFSDVRINPPLSGDEFNFIPPKGVDVLEDKEQDKPKNKEQDKPAVRVEEPAVVQEQNAVPVEVQPEVVQPENQAADEFVNEEEVTPTRHKPKAKVQPLHHEKHKDSSTEKSKAKTTDSSSKAKSKDKSKDKKADNSKEKSKDKSSDKKSKEKSSSKSKEKSSSKSNEKTKEKHKEKHK
jgi:outer membrane lipoprotein carrier protein